MVDFGDRLNYKQVRDLEEEISQYCRSGAVVSIITSAVVTKLWDHHRKSASQLLTDLFRVEFDLLRVQIRDHVTLINKLLYLLAFHLFLFLGGHGFGFFSLLLFVSLVSRQFIRFGLIFEAFFALLKVGVGLVKVWDLLKQGFSRLVSHVHLLDKAARVAYSK